MNPSIQNIKRYHIAKVYRRDQPAMTKGRMREFYQCDFDIAGNYDPMLPDAEILRIVCEIFGGLGWDGRFLIKINHRGVLDGIFEVCGVPKEKIRTISSAVDKLDKSPWEEVRREMTEEKGLDGEIADRIWGFVQRRGGRDVLEALRQDESVKSNTGMTKAMDDMDLLFTYLEAFNILSKVEFNLSLARGLDYYTGVIFEVVTEGSAPPSTTTPGHKPAKKPKSNDFDEDRSNDPSVGVGSVAAGGRYDELVGMFSGKKQIPCVGISFGVDRILSVTKARMQKDMSAGVRSNEVDVYVMAFGGKGFTGLLKERMEVSRILWDAGIKVTPSPHFYPLHQPLPILIPTPKDRIRLQNETQTRRAIQSRRSRRRALRRHPRGRRTGAGQSQDQRDGVGGWASGKGGGGGGVGGVGCGGEREVGKEGQG